MNIRKPLLLVIVLALTIFSCNDDDIEELLPYETTGLRVAFILGTEDFPTALTDVLEFNGGYIIVEQLEFEGELDSDYVNENASRNDDDDDDDNDEIEVEVDFENGARFDFGTELFSSELLIEIPQGLYDEFSLEVDLYDEGNEPSLVLTGSFNDGENAVPVIFQLKDDDFDFEIEADDFRIEASSSSIVLVQLYPGKWFNNVSKELLANASRTEGIIIISETSNSNIYDLVEKSIERLPDYLFQ